MANGIRLRKPLAATTAAISWEIYTDITGEDFDIDRITLKFASAPTSAGLVLLKQDTTAGAVIASVNPVGATSVSFDDVNGFDSDVKCILEYANPNTISITGVAVYQRWRFVK